MTAALPDELRGALAAAREASGVKADLRRRSIRITIAALRRRFRPSQAGAAP